MPQGPVEVKDLGRLVVLDKKRVRQWLLDCSRNAFWLPGFHFGSCWAPGASGRAPEPRLLALGGFPGAPEAPGPGPKKSKNPYLAQGPLERPSWSTGLNLSSLCTIVRARPVGMRTEVGRSETGPEQRKPSLPAVLQTNLGGPLAATQPIEKLFSKPDLGAKRLLPSGRPIN